MRSGLAQIVVFATVGLLAGQVLIHAQQADATVIPEVQDQSYCPRSSPSREVQPSVNSLEFA